MKTKKIIVIGGPTASGKTGLALKIAEKIKGQIVNADAIQVYKDLQILSARPTAEEQGKIPHHLFGYVDAWTTPSVQDWLTQVSEILPSLENPIFVGGTGFYIEALINGLNEMPDVPPEIRKQVREMDIAEVRKKVKDAVFTDPQRLRRSLEIQLTTGKPLIYFQKLPKKQFVSGDFTLIHLLPPKEVIHENIEKRLIAMLQQGIVDEVKHLREIKATGGVTKAIGVPEIMAMLDGKITNKEMVEKILLATKHYAKRQMTWFRHQGTPNIVLDSTEALNIQEITK